MEKILEELKKLNEFNLRKEEYTLKTEEIKQGKKELENLNEKMKLTLLGTLDRDMAQKKIEDKRRELEDAEKSISGINEKNLKEFEMQKKEVITAIDEEMSKYKSKEEIDNLVAQKNAYSRMVENSKKDIEKILNEINEGKDVDISRLKVARGEVKENSQKIEKIEKELEEYKIKDENLGVISDLNYLKMRIQNMNFDAMKNIEEDEFFKQYGNIKDNENLNAEEVEEIEEVEETEKVEEVEEAKEAEEVEEIEEAEEPEEANFKQGEENKKMRNDAIEITYNAKKDQYLIENIETGKVKEINRKDLIGLNKELLANKMGKSAEDFMHVDCNILEILSMYDKENNTRKMNDYFQTMTTFGKTKKIRMQEMKGNKIAINYDLRGLYDKATSEEMDDVNVSSFTTEERKMLLEIANDAKSMGVATVKKGIKVTIGELLDKVTTKIKSSKLLSNKKVIKLIGSKRREDINYEENENSTDKGYENLTNKEYLKSIEKDYEDELNRIKVDDEIQQKLNNAYKNRNLNQENKNVEKNNDEEKEM